MLRFMSCNSAREKVKNVEQRGNGGIYECEREKKRERGGTGIAGDQRVPSRVPLAT